MKKDLIALIPIVLSILALIILWGTFSIPHQAYYDGNDAYPFSEGNAPVEIRESIQTQLAYFEKGYLDRDVEIIEEYCNRLVSKENILILGTMPGEIYSGYDAASELHRIFNQDHSPGYTITGSKKKIRVIVCTSPLRWLPASASECPSAARSFRYPE